MTRSKLLIIGGFLLCLLVFLLLHAFTSPSELSEDKFVELYVKLSFATEMSFRDTLSSDRIEKLKEEKEKILEQLGINQKQLDNFVTRYNQKPQEWGRVWKKIVEKLSAESTKEKRKKGYK